MGLLDSFEKGLERAVNSAFAKTFRSGIQPVEIASALRSELDTKAAVVSRDRILAPNTFTVLLAPADDDRMRTLGSALGDELDALVQKHAKAQGYSFAGPVTISLVRDDQLSTGTLRVQSATAQGRVAWRGVVDIDGTRHPLTRARTVIGRGSDADITIPDAGTSRKHVEILWDGERAMVRDLQSTNGTKLDGRPVTEAPLPPDATVSIGRTNIVFHVVAQTTPARPPMPAADATRAFTIGDDVSRGPRS
ncbi:FhaA domain-containing protein [Microbacterium sp. P03]|uniref:FhaA domain-containing protein n=1 Tax=Microbacterium sp. P03 TaxID=3366946 RepID=UPI003745BE24